MVLLINPSLFGMAFLAWFAFFKTVCKKPIISSLKQQLSIPIKVYFNF